MITNSCNGQGCEIRRIYLPEGIVKATKVSAKFPTFDKTNKYGRKSIRKIYSRPNEGHGI